MVCYSPFCVKSERLSSPAKPLHHSVNFYFIVLSEPSQDSSLGQFLFYRPARTVTGLIIDEGKHLCFQLYYIFYFYYLQPLKSLKLYKTSSQLDIKTKGFHGPFTMNLLPTINKESFQKPSR